MASKLLVLGARPFGITPGGGCLALFITLLQLATMVRIVSDSSWDTFLQGSEKQKLGIRGIHSQRRNGSVNIAAPIVQPWSRLCSCAFKMHGSLGHAPRQQCKHRVVKKVLGHPRTFHSIADLVQTQSRHMAMHAAERTNQRPNVSPGAGLQAGEHGGQGLWGQLRTLGLILVWGQASHDGGTSPLQECHTRLDKRLLKTKARLVSDCALHLTGVAKGKGATQGPTPCSLILSVSHLSSLRYSRREASAARSMTKANGVPLSNIESDWGRKRAKTQL